MLNYFSNTEIRRHLKEPTIGQTIRMGYKDAESGFIVKAILNMPGLGTAVEIEPVNYSYKTDAGITYIVKLEDVE